jgi:CMP-N-acetylneuraminic acid synthetase
MVAAKHDSRRFPGKNRFVHDGVPLFWHSVRPLLDAPSVDRVLVGTDSPEIREYCEARGVEVVWRPRVAAEPEASLLTVLRFMYQHLDEQPEMVVSIMANCPGHIPEVVETAIAKMRACRLKEVRSFTRDGDESGLLALRPEVIARISEISSYMGIVTSDVEEVHNREDLSP